MNNYYFTFGSDSRFPFERGEYVLVKANDSNEACQKFKTKYPNRPGSMLINCAGIYTEKQFDKFRDLYYAGVEPADTIE